MGGGEKQGSERNDETRQSRREESRWRETRMKTEEEKPKDSPEEREGDAHRGPGLGWRKPVKQRAKRDPKKERAVTG